MNRIKLIDHLSNLLFEAKQHGSGPFHFCITDGVLSCLNPCHQITRHPTFGTLSLYEINYGLSCDAWLKIAAPIIQYVERFPQCLKAPKLSPPASKDSCSTNSGPENTKRQETQSPAETTQ